MTPWSTPPCATATRSAGARAACVPGPTTEEPEQILSCCRAASSSLLLCPPCLPPCSLKLVKRGGTYAQILVKPRATNLLG